MDLKTMSYKSELERIDKELSQKYKTQKFAITGQWISLAGLIKPAHLIMEK